MNKPYRDIIASQWESVCRRSTGTDQGGTDQGGTDQGGTERIGLPHVELICRWQRMEPLACSVTQIQWQVPASLTWDRERIEGWAQRVADSVTYLTEPLALWEIDQLDRVAIVRSAQVRPRPEGREFFELLWRPTGGALQRLSIGPDGRRQTVSFPLVHDSVIRLLADLADVLVDRPPSPTAR
jgi:hypothetical protein